MEGWVVGRVKLFKVWKYEVVDVWVKEGGKWVKLKYESKLVDGVKCWRWVEGKWVKVVV